MIQVFCAKRGSGKTKRLIELANSRYYESKGDSVYIDDDSRPMHELNTRIRFVETKEYNVKCFENFYGMICGIISSNYDIENIYIDGLSNIVECEIVEASDFMNKLSIVTERYNINFYININVENNDEVPDFIRKYVA